MPSQELAAKAEAGAADKKCLYCGKPAALDCVPCRQAGRPAFSYCGRECQKKHWPEHKNVCPYRGKGNKQGNVRRGGASSSSAASPGPAAASAADASVESETAATARSGIRKALKQVSCQQCGKDTTTNRLVCSKCKSVHYCSKECQVANWPVHKKECSSNVQVRKVAEEEGMAGRMDLLQQWKRKAGGTICFAAAHALSNRQFRQQPPSHVVWMEVGFNYNLRTFVFTEEPKTVEISDLPEDIRPGVLQKITKEEELKRQGAFDEDQLLHIALIIFDAMVSVKPMVIASESKQYDSVSDWDKVVILTKEVKLKSNLFDDWYPPMMTNLNLQVNALRENDAWGLFLHHAFRLYSNKPRHKTHALGVNFEFGLGLGDMESLTSYEVMPLEEARDIATRGRSEAERRVFLDLLDVNASPALLQSRVARPSNVLLPVLFMHQPTNVVFCSPNLVEMDLFRSSGGIAVKKCDKKAAEAFSHLRAAVTELPSVSSPPLH